MQRKLNYLIIEDDVTSVLITKWELVRKGFTVQYHHVQNEQQMRLALANHYFDVIISDHHMPSFSSIEALTIRNEMASMVPFIIVSSNIPNHIEQQALFRGCNAVLEKERISVLVHIMEEIVSNNHTNHYM